MKIATAVLVCTLGASTMLSGCLTTPEGKGAVIGGAAGTAVGAIASGTVGGATGRRRGRRRRRLPGRQAHLQVRAGQHVRAEIYRHLLALGTAPVPAPDVRGERRGRLALFAPPH